ncbi:sorbosone dehydrogenase family protein [Frigoribacterium sp. CFBP 13707]|uniref:PQQ-dependent sugar dehydrogenase n=1 Tax=Frigoribacterium sp. CFBP 13707 TaxID=2775313 RepID=UPI0035302EE7
MTNGTSPGRATTRKTVRAVVAVAAAGVLASAVFSACTSTGSGMDRPPSSSATSGASPTAPLVADAPTQMASGLEAPWSIAFLRGTPLVSERDSGRVLELTSTGETRVVGTVPGVQPDGEGGLLGLAVGEDDRLYVYSTGEEGNRIERYTLTGEAGSLELGPGESIIDGIASAGYHNGGRIAFGPDGMLYAGVGDAGQSSASQDPDSLSGKILRMNADGSVPADNPFPGSVVYSLGHRNVQGLGWAADGTMFASEFGQNTWDELNIIEAGGNYGWPEAEGFSGGEDYIDPVQQWSPADASPSGITVTADTVFIANLRGEVLRAVPVADPTTATDYYEGEFGRIRAVTEGPDGNLWFLTGNTNSQGTPRDGDDKLLRVPLTL